LDGIQQSQIPFPKDHPLDNLTVRRPDSARQPSEFPVPEKSPGNHSGLLQFRGPSLPPEPREPNFVFRNAAEGIPPK
jgi:hypothetical protein